MMGRLSGYDEREHGNVAQGNYFPAEQNRAFQNRNIPVPQNYSNVSLPHLQTNPYHSLSSSPPTIVDRAHSSFQETHRPIPVREPKLIRSCTSSPTFKLPPLPTPKPAQKPAPINMPPRNITEIPLHFPPKEPDSTKEDTLDIKEAYENMMIGYFMPSFSKDDCLTQREALQIDPLNATQYIAQDSKIYAPQDSQQTLQYIPQFPPAPFSTMPPDFHQTLQTNQMHNLIQRSKTNTSLSQRNFIENVPKENLSSTVSDHMNKMIKPENSYRTSSSVNMVDSSSQTFPSDIPNQTEVPAMASVLNDFNMFMPSQQTHGAEPMFHNNNNNRAVPSSDNVNTALGTVAQSSSVPYQTRIEPNWGSFSVLPPVIPSVTPSASGVADGDNASLFSYASVTGNAQVSSSQMGLYYNAFSPFSANFTENVSSAFTTSPRYSARSSYSGRSRNKRALSNSPLSADGIDINSIIRMSPTSLNAYLNGSRSSSSCVSPGSLGDKTGCYGHLSARNSSSSPQSGSGSSGNRRSGSFTPRSSTPSITNTSNVTSENSNASLSCNNGERMKNEFMNLDNLFIMQAMQDLDSGAGLPNLPPILNVNVISNAQAASEHENLQVLPQDLAAFRTEDYIPFIPSVLPPVHTHLPSQFQPVSSQTLPTMVSHTKPPPTYDQHMARKATLQKNSSSDSSQPSNSNSSSFESSEGDKTVAGSSGTDTESNRMHACRWLDCTAVFQDQDDFVTHIEKVHIDQKKGDDFVCFWKLCPRRLHPFNARYKLLVHMRIHSGDKPNKCTYAGCSKAFSRLENLKIHLRSHTGERPYSCTFSGCSKTFSNSSDRTKHQKTHHETKPYVCQFVGCDKRYTDPSSLRKHVKKSHPDKKEPDRKKIRSAVEELDPRDLSECLVIQSIKPMSLYDASPPEPTDSGLGRSPRSSQPGSSSDHYPGLMYCGEVQGTSSQTSPSSQHSSPPGQNDREKLPPNNNSLRVPILPPIAPSPIQQHPLSFPHLKSPASSATPTFARVSSSSSVVSRNSSSHLQRPKLASEGLVAYNDPSASPNSRGSNSFEHSLRYQ